MQSSQSWNVFVMNNVVVLQFVYLYLSPSIVYKYTWIFIFQNLHMYKNLGKCWFDFSYYCNIYPIFRAHYFLALLPLTNWKSITFFPQNWNGPLGVIALQLVVSMVSKWGFWDVKKINKIIHGKRNREEDASISIGHKNKYDHVG